MSACVQRLLHITLEGNEDGSQPSASLQGAVCLVIENFAFIPQGTTDYANTKIFRVRKREPQINVSANINTQTFRSFLSTAVPTGGTTARRFSTVSTVRNPRRCARSLYFTCDCSPGSSYYIYPLAFTLFSTILNLSTTPCLSTGYRNK